MKERAHDVGVVVARFQVDDLHDGHRRLLKRIIVECQRTIVVLGVPPTRATRENPLPFQARKQMLEEFCRDIEVLYLNDTPDDADWSESLDRLVEMNTGPGQDIALYGGRDSFIDRYTTKRYPTELLDDESYIIYSGTEVRRQAGVGIGNSRDWRKGVIWATHNSYQTVWPTVDVAIFNEDGSKVLLGRKPKEKLLRFPGGFVNRADKDVVSGALEANARREIREECGDIEIGDLRYVGSCQVKDWRYGQSCRIITTLFKTTLCFGRPEAGDDLEHLEWVEFDHIVLENLVMDVHQPLVRLLLEDAKRA